MSGVSGVGVLAQPGGDRPWWWVEPRGGNGGGAGGGGAVEGGDLKHSDGPWMRAAGGAEGLVAHLGPVKAELGRAHQGLTAGAGELSALAELGTVRASWERRIETARDECRSLAGKLRGVTVTQSEVNGAVKGSFDGVRVAGPGSGPGLGSGSGAGATSGVKS
ncbi:hypothetical protein ACH4A7_09185 [Streptomyces cyaneofuscatus]|uniref:hypothetical protein n=1 Tax=Streptomyces TaxID=1883 RepID=UPI00378F7810|nr:hypothetical protein OG366_19890 [Streptomyces cyaneofuscatus]WTF36398.1 hypothetical protein OG973_16850 [Streptomyces cyaneofuscatus]